MADAIINCTDPSDADVVILGANYDETSSYGKGADQGPKAVARALDDQIERGERFTETEPSNHLQIAYLDLGDLNQFAPEEMIDRVQKEFYKHYRNRKFVITLGGEHTVSNGPFRTLAQADNPKNITIVQIDAHFDMRDTDADYRDNPFGRYAHSTVMRRAAELGFPMVQVGIRDYSPEEKNFARTHGSKFFEWGNGVKYDVGQIVATVPTDRVYLTIDIDGFDPSVMPATGTPVSGGLKWNYTNSLLHMLFQRKDVIAADIMEVAPRHPDDPVYSASDRLTVRNAAQLGYNIIAWRFHYNLGRI